MANLKALSLRIKSIKSVQKTTKVMQMISASKFRIAKDALTYTREYCEAVHGELEKVKSCVVPTEEDSADPTGELIIVLSSDRGLCGGFNHSIVRFLREYLASYPDQEDVKFLFVGKKAHDLMRAHVPSARVEGVIPQQRGSGFASFKLFLYQLGIDFASFSKVSVLYSKFRACSAQEPVLEELLRAETSANASADGESQVEKEAVCRYDPDMKLVYRKLWMNYLVGRLYLSMCESLTCEHFCRMVAMESANSNTKSMLSRLLLLYNRSRQAAITSDLIEVVSGCEALG